MSQPQYPQTPSQAGYVLRVQDVPPWGEAATAAAPGSHSTHRLFSPTGSLNLVNRLLVGGAQKQTRFALPVFEDQFMM